MSEAAVQTDQVTVHTDAVMLHTTAGTVHANTVTLQTNAVTVQMTAGAVLTDAVTICISPKLHALLPRARLIAIGKHVLPAPLFDLSSFNEDVFDLS